MAKYFPLEVRRARRAKAMPEVKRLVVKYGRSTIVNCLNQLKEKEKTLKKVEALKKELSRLEKTC